MKYLVMENYESHSVVMDEHGLFHRVANLGYEIGDTVTEPVFMKTPEKKKKYNWKKISTVAAIFVCMLLTAIPLINNSTESDVVVYMSINPQIHLEMNEDGKINKLIADNEDGKTLLEDYNYKGKNAATVLIDLVERAKKLDYLSDGGDIHITVEAGSEGKAKIVEVDLSEALYDTYAKKYVIKIKANREEFRELDAVLSYEQSSSTSEAEIITSENKATSEYYRTTTESHTEETVKITQSTVESTTAPATESQAATTKPTEPPTTVPTSEADDFSENDDSEFDDSDDEDTYWPWWPRAF